MSRSNESCHTCGLGVWHLIESCRIWMSNVTYNWIMSLVNVTCVTCHTCGSGVSRRQRERQRQREREKELPAKKSWSRRRLRRLCLMYECHGTWHTREWVMPRRTCQQSCRRRDQDVRLRIAYTNELWHICEWIMSCTWLFHVTQRDRMRMSREICVHILYIRNTFYRTDSAVSRKTYLHTCRQRRRLAKETCVCEWVMTHMRTSHVTQKIPAKLSSERRGLANEATYIGNFSSLATAATWYLAHMNEETWGSVSNVLAVDTHSNGHRQVYVCVCMCVCVCVCVRVCVCVCVSIRMGIDSSLFEFQTIFWYGVDQQEHSDWSK